MLELGQRREACEEEEEACGRRVPRASRVTVHKAPSYDFHSGLTVTLSFFFLFLEEIKGKKEGKSKNTST